MRLRKKIPTEKVYLEKTICKYNQLVTDQPIQKDDIEKGHFPSNESSSDAGIAFLCSVVPVRSLY